MSKMYVVGRTTPKEIVIASTDRRFISDEYLVVQDELSGSPLGEVIGIKSYPRVESNTFTTESGIYQSLKELSLLKDGSGIHIATIKMLDELESPVTPHAEVNTPKFEDIEDMLVPVSPKNGLVLGVVRGTERIQELLPPHLQNLAPMFEKGKGIIAQQGIPFVLSHYKLREYPHIGFFGGTGSGKTHGLRVACEEIMHHSIPGVALDPHYELKFDKPTDGLDDEHIEDFSNKHEIFQIGENVGIKFTELNTEELLTMLEFVGDLTEPMRGAIEAIHEKSDSFSTLVKRVNDLKSVFMNMEKPQREREHLHDDIVLMYDRFKNKVSGAPTLQAISWRLETLNKTGIFNHDISKVELCVLKRKLAVIRGEVKLLRMLASYLFRKLYGKRRKYKDWEQKNLHNQSNDMPQKFPPFFIVLDESHIFAPNGEKMNPTKSILREISQEARKYGVFLVLGTQRPSLLDTTIASMLNTKIIFRTSIEADMKMIKTETNLNVEQAARLPDLPTGNAFIASATLKKTFYIRFRTTKTTSPHEGHPFDELDDFDATSKLKGILKKHLPLSNDLLPKKHADINNSMGRLVDSKEIMKVLEEMAIQKEAKKDESPFGVRYLPTA